MKKLKISSPLYITKRIGISTRDAWLIRIAGIFVALLLSALFCNFLSPGSFGTYISSLFEGNFSSTSYIFNLLCLLSVYLLLALAVTPAFKMKFWNIGAEGQALAGCIVTAVILLKMPTSVPDVAVILLALVAGVIAGVAWAIIPTYFKIKFKTNETLFTLMMNYVAMSLASVVVAIFAQGGTQQFPTIPTNRTIVEIGGINFLPFIIASVVITIFMILYLKKSKHGFELSVLGDSRNTARYVGMKINKVTMRTMIISGAIAGLVGFLLVCGRDKTLSPNLVAGRGFTSVLIAWLGHFNPSEIVIYSFLISFLDQGTTYAASKVKLSKNYFAGMIIGLFIIVVVVTEFFVRYRMNRRIANEVSEVKDQVISTPDSQMTKDSLLAIFAQLGTTNLKNQLVTDKIKLKETKKNTKEEYKRIQWLITKKNNLHEREKLQTQLLDIQKTYHIAKQQYKDNKHSLKIKRKNQRMVVKANAIRVKRAIKNRCNTTLLVFKSGTMVYPNKVELKNALRNLNYTAWDIPNVLIKNIITAHKKLNKQAKNVITKHRHAKTLTKDEISAFEISLFNYWLTKSNYRLFHYLKRAKFLFALKAKIINARNLRAQKKQNQGGQKA